MQQHRLHKPAPNATGRLRPRLSKSDGHELCSESDMATPIFASGRESGESTDTGGKVSWFCQQSATLATMAQKQNDAPYIVA